MQHISIHVRHRIQASVELGVLRALRIRRRRCRGDLLRIMHESGHDEFFAFASTLFDRYGRLRPELVENEYLKGTGVWGRELDDGDVLYITTTIQYGRQGIASSLLWVLIQYANATGEAKFFARPAVSKSRVGAEDQRKKQQDIASAFFSKNHFRRVGRTDFVAFTPDTAHRSHALSAADDVGAQSELFHTSTSRVPEEVVDIERLLSDMTVAADKRHTPELGAHKNATYPLHHFVGDALSFSKSDGASTIQGAYNDQPALLRQKDDRGFTLLHTAARAFNVPALQALLSLPADSGIMDDLRARDNIAGRTPLELCELEMREAMERAEMAPAGSWEGHKEDALRTVFRLRRAGGEAMSLPEDVYVARRTWGCTCGDCVGGWLSRRMQVRLRTQAELWAGKMCKNAGRIPDDDAALQCLPSYVAVGRGGAQRKRFYEAYATVVYAISFVLRQEDDACVPTPDNVRTALEVGCAESFKRVARPAAQPPPGERFFDSGGRVEHALEWVLRTATHDSPLGDGFWDRFMRDSAAAGMGLAKAYLALPRCANDLEFGRVRQRLGVPSERPWVSPYSGRGDDDKDDGYDEDEWD